MFVLALGGDCPLDVHTRTRQLIASFKRSFEMADSRSCGYAPKKSLAALIKTLMALYSQTEIKLVSQHLDGLPHMSTKSETLVDYRPLFSAGYDQPTEFMTLLATLSFRAMCTDINAAVNAVRAAATPAAAAASAAAASAAAAAAATGAAAAESGDISIGALLTALQSCDPRRELDLCKEYVQRLLGQASIKAVRVPVEALVARMRKTFLPRASPFPADLYFIYSAPSVVEVMRTDEEPPVKAEEAKK
jgi:hypothetical protein